MGGLEQPLRALTVLTTPASTMVLQRGRPGGGRCEPTTEPDVVLHGTTRLQRGRPEAAAAGEDGVVSSMHGKGRPFSLVQADGCSASAPGSMRPHSERSHVDVVGVGP